MRRSRWASSRACVKGAGAPGSSVSSPTTTPAPSSTRAGLPRRASATGSHMSFGRCVFQPVSPICHTSHSAYIRTFKSVLLFFSHSNPFPLYVTLPILHIYIKSVFSSFSHSPFCPHATLAFFLSISRVSFVAGGAGEPRSVGDRRQRRPRGTRDHCLLEKSRFSHLWRPPSLCVFPHVSGWILCFTGTRDHCLLPSLRRTHRRLPARRDLCGEGRGGSEPPLPVRHVPQHPAALGVWWPQVHTPMHAARMPEDPRALWSVRHFAPSRLTAPREERRRVQSFGGKKRAVSPMCAARIHSVFFPSVSGWILFARRWSVDLSRRCSQMTAPPSSPLTSQVRASFA